MYKIPFKGDCPILHYYLNLAVKVFYNDAVYKN